MQNFNQSQQAGIDYRKGRKGVEDLTKNLESAIQKLRKIRALKIAIFKLKYRRIEKIEVSKRCHCSKYRFGS